MFIGREKELESLRLLLYKRTCKGTVMRERLVDAIDDAERQGLVGRQEYQELKKEFAQ